MRALAPRRDNRACAPGPGAKPCFRRRRLQFRGAVIGNNRRAGVAPFVRGDSQMEISIGEARVIGDRFAMPRWRPVGDLPLGASETEVVLDQGIGRLQQLALPAGLIRNGRPSKGA